MNIPDYQIDNILEQFGKHYLKKHLERKGTAGASPALAKEPADGPRQNISRRVAADILERVAHLDQEDGDRPTSLETEAKGDRRDGMKISEGAISSRESEFSFIVVGKDNRKRTRTIPVGNPDAFLVRLERLARQAGQKGSARITNPEQ